MTDLQKRVAEGFVTYNNISKAAKFAGIEGDNARISAWQMLQYNEVQDYIDQLRIEQAERTYVTADKVQAEIARLAFSDLREYYDSNGFLKNPHDLSDDAAAALAGIEVDELWGIGMSGDKEKIGETKKIKLYDKLAALDKLARRLGMFKEDNDQTKPINNIDFRPVINTQSPPLSDTEK